MIIFHFLLSCMILTFGSITWASEHSHPFYLLQVNESQLKFRVGPLKEEHEFEKANVVQDLFQYEHWVQSVEGLFKLHNERQIGIGLEVLTFGKLSKDYSSTLNIPSQSLDYSGFHAVTFFYQEFIPTKNDKNKLAFEIRLKGSPLTGREKTNTYNGLDVSLSYLYSHQHDEWLVYGDLQADIIGSKRIRKDNGEIETINSYSRFGNLLGLQWKQKKFWVNLEGYFYLTTDYNSISPSYTRLTDKGFVVGGAILFGYEFNDKFYMTLSHDRHSSVFNIITESTTEGTEFEIETEQTILEAAWSF